jgi:predicted class III extradiol MEMO1 family dioxygenase
MSQDTDEQEHSIELHLPYIRHVWKEYVHRCATTGRLVR